MAAGTVCRGRCVGGKVEAEGQRSREKEEEEEGSEEQLMEEECSQAERGECGRGGRASEQQRQVFQKAAALPLVVPAVWHQ